MTSSASGERSVTISTVAPSGSGRARSRTSPSTFTASAARASPAPIDAARSAPVAPSGSSLREPSGRTACIGGNPSVRSMDPAAFRSRFPVLERIAYLNAGSDGPLPHAAVAAAREALDVQETGGRTLAHFMARQETDAALREIYAARLGAPPEDVA